MARRKVKLAWIANDAARKASLKKRRLGLVKKVTELATLCAVDACVIIVCHEDQQQPTMIWPSDDKLYHLMSRFYSIPVIERRKKAMNQEIYLKERVSKLKDTLKKSMTINKEMEMIDLMYKIQNKSKDFNELDLNEIRGLTWLMEEKSKLINRRQGAFFPGDSQLAVANTNFVPVQVAGGVGGTQAATDDFLDWSTPTPLHAPTLDPATWGWYLNLMSADNIIGGADLGLHDPEPYQFNGGSHGGALGPDHHVWGMHQELNYNINQGGYMNTNMAFAVGGGEPYYVMAEDVKPIIQQLPGNFPEFGNNNFSYQVANYELQAAENNTLIGNPGNDHLIEAAMANGHYYYGADIPMFNYGGANTSGAMTDYGGGSDYIPTFNYGGAMTDNGGASTSYTLPPSSPNNNFGI